MCVFNDNIIDSLKIDVIYVQNFICDTFSQGKL